MEPRDITLQSNHWSPTPWREYNLENVEAKIQKTLGHKALNPTTLNAFCAAVLVPGSIHQGAAPIHSLRRNMDRARSNGHEWQVQNESRQEENWLLQGLRFRV